MSARCLWSQRCAVRALGCVGEGLDLTRGEWAELKHTASATAALLQHCGLVTIQPRDGDERHVCLLQRPEEARWERLQWALDRMVDKVEESAGAADAALQDCADELAAQVPSKRWETAGRSTRDYLYNVGRTDSG